MIGGAFGSPGGLRLGRFGAFGRDFRAPVRVRPPQPPPFARGKEEERPIRETSPIALKHTLLGRPNLAPFFFSCVNASLLSSHMHDFGSAHVGAKCPCFSFLSFYFCLFCFIKTMFSNKNEFQNLHELKKILNSKKIVQFIRNVLEFEKCSSIK